MKMEMTQKNRQIWLVFHWNSKGKPQQVSGVCLIAQEQNGCFFLELVLVWFVVLFIYYFFLREKWQFSQDSFSETPGPCLLRLEKKIALVLGKFQLQYVL